MTVRDVNSEDLPQIERIHAAMGMDYKMPDLSRPLFLVRKLIEDKNGIRAACCLKLTAETYLWVNPSLNPREKMDAMLELQPVILQSAWEKGLDDIVSWIPEDMQKRFQRRLKQLGWSKNRTGWDTWSHSLQGETR